MLIPPTFPAIPSQSSAYVESSVFVQPSPRYPVPIDPAYTTFPAAAPPVTVTSTVTTTKTQLVPAPSSVVTPIEIASAVLPSPRPQDSAIVAEVVAFEKLIGAAKRSTVTEAVEEDMQAGEVYVESAYEYLTSVMRRRKVRRSLEQSRKDTMQKRRVAAGIREGKYFTRAIYIPRTC